MVDPEEILLSCVGFEWDKGNFDKNRVKHGVSLQECEQVFFNQPLAVFEDFRHSEREKRHYVLGQTDEGRSLFVVFMIRQNYIRVISARDMNRKERRDFKSYETEA